MSVIESLRKRFDNNLASHTVDEEYTVSPSTSRSSGSSGAPTVQTYTIANQPSYLYVHPAAIDIFDPDEEVPLYESSQMLHVNSELDHPSRDLSQSRNTSFHHLVPPLPGPNLRTSSNSTPAPNELTPEPPAVTSTFAWFSLTRKLDAKRSLKRLGLKFLNARQHFLLASCRDLSLVPPLIGLIQSWKRVFLNDPNRQLQTSARVSEHFLAGVWCIVSGYLSYSLLDGLMIRWIVNYSTSAAIVRMLSMSVMIITIEQYLASTFSADGYRYGLHIWILISCCLTFLYIIQSFVTSNLDLKGKRRARFFDFYNIIVFAVVPVGVASFITMVGLLRSLLILRLDIDQQS